MLLFSTLGGGGLPLGLPPGEEDPLMARIAPDECLAYVSWAGSGKPDASSENDFEQLLAESEVQFMFSEIERLIDAALDDLEGDEGDEEAKLARQAVTWARRFLTRPGAAYVSKFFADKRDEPEFRGGVVLTVGDDGPELRKLWDTIRIGAPEGAVREVEIGGTTMFRIPGQRGMPTVTLGIKGKYFYVGFGDEAVEGILKRAETATPKWLANLRKQLEVDRPSVVTFVNAGTIIEKLGQTVLRGGRGTVMLEALGLRNLKTLASVGGLDQSGYVTRAIVGFDGKPSGLLAAALGQPLTLAELEPIPKDATLAVAARLDAAKMFDSAIATFEKVIPGSGAEIRAEIGRAEEELGFRIRDDLVGGLGDTICLYHSSGEGGLLAGFAAVVGVKDREKLARVEESIKKTMRAAEALGRDFGFGPRMGTTTSGDDKIHFIRFLDDDFLLCPAWCLTDDSLVIGLFPQTVKAYLSRGDNYESLAAVPEVADAFKNKNGPIKIVYQDTRKVFELAYPFVQIATQMISGEFREDGVDLDVSILPSGQSIAKHLHPDILTVSKTENGIEIVNRQSAPGSNSAMFLPAVAIVGSAGSGGRDLERIIGGVGTVLSPSKASEKASLNNLRAIGIAMHNYHDTYKEFPPAFTVNDDDKPQLSWRVTILPFVEEIELYERFNLDEPWDSENNRALIPLMPKVYRTPGSHQMPGMTNYVTIRGERTIFFGKKGSSMRHIIDGTSNTLFAMEVGDDRAVVWTKPDDYNLDPMNPIKGIVGLRRDGFLGGFADGSVRKISGSIDKEMLMRIFEKNDGKPIDYRAIDANPRRRSRIDVSPAEAFDPPASDDVPDDDAPDPGDSKEARESGVEE